MSLRIYNTLTGAKEEFKPLKEGEVRMYVCGVTVYDRCHVGHARAGVVFDFVFRSLEWLGYKVTYVRNFTDVDDKIIDRAREKGITCEELVEENIRAFYDDMDSLYLKRPTHEPRATRYIESMIELISGLIGKGLAYQSGRDVYFAVSHFPEYGRLSRKNIEDLLSGARVEVSDAKRDPLDFALWKGAKPGEPKWPSPWGEGRPGWHIECSAMGRELLGERFDIHGGGKDLVFPHHENEIAQSQGVSGHPPVNYWMHNGFVNINREKMSKSLGNFFTIKDVLARFDAEAVRLYLLSTHYRSPIDFADPYLLEAERHLDRLYETAARADALLGSEGGTVKEEMKKRVREAIEEDFNSAAVLAIFNDVVHRLNELCDVVERKKKGWEEAKGELADNRLSLKEIAGVMGILNRKPQEYLESVKEKRLGAIGMSDAEVKELVELRRVARASKNWAESDRIRDELAGKGIELKDTPEGTTYTVKAGF